MIVNFPISTVDRDARRRESECTLRQWQRDGALLDQAVILHLPTRANDNARMWAAVDALEGRA